MVQAVATSVYRKRNEKTIGGAQSSVLKCQVPALEKMLWGGTVMLIVDHIINGELTWRAPFFTALNEVNGVDVMLRELLCVGLPMSVAITAVWAVWAILKARKKAIA